MIKFTGVLLVTLVILGGFAAKSEAQLAPQCQGAETPEETGCTPWYIAPTDEQITQIQFKLVYEPPSWFQVQQHVQQCQITMDLIKAALTAMALVFATDPDAAPLFYFFSIDAIWWEIFKTLSCKPENFGG